MKALFVGMFWAVAAGAALAQAPTADPKAGQTYFNKVCVVCHTHAANPMGPELAGVVGRAPAKAPGFAYSGALKAKPVIWDDASLDAYLKSPAAFAPGTSMTINVGKAADRANVIAYLKTLK